MTEADKIRCRESARLGLKAIQRSVERKGHNYPIRFTKGELDTLIEMLDADHAHALRIRDAGTKSVQDLGAATGVASAGSTEAHADD